uniref:hypothetical protein n=1 Tax=Tetragenococcus halophilus TaxID=51669 RepID=UPI0024E18DD7|nr:hypothetical protein [Tetragenococcus halophilus]
MKKDSSEILLDILKRYPDLYKAFKNTTLDTMTFSIPGLFKAQTLEKDSKKLDDCYDITPQGLAVTENYIFISAYCYSHKHYSVIFMLDKKENNSLKIIILKDRTHAGGLVYDENRQCLWVCSAAKIHGRVSAIFKEDILNYPLSKHEAISYYHNINFPTILQASFITMKENTLFVGTFNKRKNGVVLKTTFEHEDFDNSRKEESIRIPKKAQGMAFYKEYCLISQSFGPSSSKIYIFSNEQLSSGKLDIKNALKIVKTPPYLEQITVFEDHLYAIFESGARNYREKTAKFLMEVLAFHLPTLLDTVE